MVYNEAQWTKAMRDRIAREHGFESADDMVEGLRSLNERGTAIGLKRAVDRALDEAGFGRHWIEFQEPKRFFSLSYIPPFTFRFNTHRGGVYRVVVTIPVSLFKSALAIEDLVSNVIYEYGPAGSEGLVSIRFTVR